MHLASPFQLAKSQARGGEGGGDLTEAAPRHSVRRMEGAPAGTFAAWYPKSPGSPNFARATFPAAPGPGAGPGHHPQPPRPAVPTSPWRRCCCRRRAVPAPLGFGSVLPNNPHHREKRHFVSAQVRGRSGGVGRGRGSAGVPRTPGSRALPSPSVRDGPPPAAAPLRTDPRVRPRASEGSRIPPSPQPPYPSLRRGAPRRQPAAPGAGAAARARSAQSCLQIFHTRTRPRWLSRLLRGAAGLRAEPSGQQRARRAGERARSPERPRVRRLLRVCAPGSPASHSIGPRPEPLRG